MALWAYEVRCVKYMRWLRGQSVCLLALLWLVGTVLGCTLDNSLKGSLGNESENPEDVTPLLVKPVYTNNGANWNDHISSTSSEPLDGVDTPCNVATDSYCLNGGLLRSSLLAGESSCSQITGEDQLGVFDWSCVEVAGYVVVYSTGLKSGKSLANLLVGLGFKANKLVVKKGGVEIGASESEVWWGNPVKALPDNSGVSDDAIVLDGTDDDGLGPDEVYQAGTIFTLSSSRATSGYGIDLDRVSVVGLSGAQLTYSGNTNFNCEAATGELGTPAQHCLIFAGGQKHLWIEGNFSGEGGAQDTLNVLNLVGLKFGQVSDLDLEGGTGAGLYANTIEHSTISRVVATNHGTHGIHVEGVTTNNVLDSLTLFSNGNGGLYFANGGTQSLIQNVVAYSNGDEGVHLDYADANTVKNISTHNNGGRGLFLDNSNDNRVYTVKAAANTGDGIGVVYSNRNVIVGAYSYENQGPSGLYVNHADENTFVRVLTTNNAQRGIYYNFSADKNTLLNGTSVSNAWVNWVVGQTTGNVGSQVVLSNSLVGLALNSDAINGFYHNLAAIDQIFPGFDISTNANDNIFDGHLRVGGNSNDCEVVGPISGTNLAVGTGACTPTGGSVTVTSGLSVATSFAGIVKNDSSNADTGSLNTDGQLAFASVTDWINFDNLFYQWGDATVFGNPVDSSNHDSCEDSGTCGIWDWRFAVGDTVIQSINGAYVNNSTCPASVHGNVATTDNHTSANTFLLHAEEVIGDELGDEDGLCESSEACIYSPNLGAFQGEGDYTTQNCTFQDGAVTGVTMYSYPP